MIFISDSYRGTAVLNVIRNVSDRFSRRFDCQCEHLKGMFHVDAFFSCLKIFLFRNFSRTCPVAGSLIKKFFVKFQVYKISGVQL